MAHGPLESTIQGWVQQRYVLSLMLFLAVVNMYTMRVCLSVAIVQMVSPADPDSGNATAGLVVEDPERCPAPDDIQDSGSDPSSAAHQGGEFSWSPQLQGVILSSFYYGYVVSHLPGGVFADRFGGKHALGLGILTTSVTTLLTPVAARQGAGWIIAVRVLMGLGEGVTFPAISALLSHWIPVTERSRLGAFVYAGAQLGSVLGNAGSGLALHRWAWPATFYIFGGLGMAWYAFWLALCYSTPAEHPFISREERDFIASQLKQAGSERARYPTPWRGILTSWPVWGLVVIQVGHDWGFFTMLTDLPKFMRSVLRYDIAQNGVLSALPYLTMWLVSLLFGALADWLIVRDLLSVLNVRRLFTSIASLSCAFGVLGASYAECDRVIVVALLTAGLGGMGGAYSGMRINALDLSRRHAGTVMALVNGVGAVSGIVSPLLIGMLTPHETMSEWRLTFWIVFGVLVVTNTIYVVLARADLQPWDRPEVPATEYSGSETHPNKHEGVRA